MDTTQLLFVKILLIFGLHISSAEKNVDIVYLQLTPTNNITEIPFKFTAFGQTIELKLRKNNKLLTSNFRTYHHFQQNFIEEIIDSNDSSYCHYLHEDDTSIAAISICDVGLQGLVLLRDGTLEITPLNTEQTVTENIKFDENIPHIVKRFYMPEKILHHLMYDSFMDNLESLKLLKAHKYYNKDVEAIHKKAEKNMQLGELELELAVFFDEPGYKIFSPFFNRDEKKIRHMLLAYINGIQALFYHPSLGIRIDIALVRLDLMKHQPDDLPHYNGERLKLLNSFCNYTASVNTPDDNDPNHWDMGLYVSGLDFFSYENGKKDGVTMGLATVSGVCLHQYSCVIAELGVTNHLGNPYPSAGFTSIYIAAHEIGHNLGMHHDSTGNACPREGFIMSPSRGTNGEIIWSSCSREIAVNLPQTKPCLLDKSLQKFDQDLDHRKFLTLPGREWTAKMQCELLLRDRNANVVTLTNACQSLQCQSPHVSGYFYAGPALDGTKCGPGKECRGGDCLPALYFFKPLNYPPSNKNGTGSNGNKIGWSNWQESSCSTGCIHNSKGFKSRKRICRNNFDNNKQHNAMCDGLSYDVQLCQDHQLCKKRITANEYAAQKCREFSEQLPELDKAGAGLQGPYEIGKPWISCVIFCRKADMNSYYTPRIELNIIGLDPYFPDGTWCHKQDDEDYFCLQHHCLPSSFKFLKDGFLKINSTHTKLLGLENTRLSKNTVSNNLLLTNSWDNNDYIELPKNLSHII